MLPVRVLQPFDIRVVIVVAPELYRERDGFAVDDLGLAERISSGRCRREPTEKLRRLAAVVAYQLVGQPKRAFFLIRKAHFSTSRISFSMVSSTSLLTWFRFSVQSAH